MTLRRQLFIALSLAFLAIFLGLLAINVHNSREYIQQQLATHAQDTATSLAPPLAAALAKDDRALADTVLAPVFDRGYFRQIAVYSPAGARIVNKELPERIEGVPLWFASLARLEPPPGEAFIAAGWRQLGKVVVISQPTFAYQQLWRETVVLFWWLFVAYLLAILFTRLVLRVVLNPLLQIERAAAAIQERHFEPIADIPKAQELRRVVLAMNDMAGKISRTLDQKEGEAEAYRRQAYEDPVTGLENRRAFDARISELLETGDSFARGSLVVLEVDGLKEFNTERGYPQGDALLADLAKAASETADGRVTICARIGGAAFAKLFLDLADGEVEELARVLQRRIDADLARREAGEAVSFNIGVAHFRAGEDRTTILSRADMAIEAARRSGRNALRAISGEESEVNGTGSFGWRMLIQNALAEHRWALLAQPVKSLAGGGILHHEVMVRLVDTEGRLVPAAQFLPMAARHGLMAEVDRAVIELALEVLARPRSGVERVALNVSTQGLDDDDFLAWLEDRLRGLGEAAGRLSFELSEFGCVRDPVNTEHFVSLVRAAGARFGIDRFGLDPRSLNTLRHLPPDYLKIDGGLVRELVANDDSRQIFRSIVELARSLDVAVIAQCVESEAVVAQVRDDGADGVQGFVIGVPERV